MLNEREIVLAKQLARELALLNETSEKDEFERMTEAISFVKDVVESAWGIVKYVILNIEEFIESMKNNNKFKHNWHVPLQIKAPPMPDIPIPRMMNIRSDL